MPSHPESRRDPLRTTRSKAAIVAVVFGLIVLLLMLFASIGLTRNTCEVCIEFGGQTRCRTAKGSTREEAVTTATQNACALLASGMTDSIRCERTPPTKVECR